MNNSVTHCRICYANQVTPLSAPSFDGDYFRCIQCGVVKICRKALVNLNSFAEDKRAKVSAWVRENQPSVVGMDDPDKATRTNPPSLEQRAARMLRYIDEHHPHGAKFALSGERIPRSNSASGPNTYGHPLVAIGWNANYEETQYMVSEVMCHELNWLSKNDQGSYFVSPKGRLYLEDGRRGMQSVQGFCAMWFDTQINALWTDVIKLAIEAAGYEPMRIDLKAHNNKIDDAIVASIRSSRFIVADFTGDRSNVYYEAGFAHGLGLPVIFMCRQDEIENLHFDVRQYNCIPWQSDQLQKAMQDLKHRIEATIGRGPK